MTHEEREIFLALIREKMPQVKVHEKERKNNSYYRPVTDR